MALSNFSKRCVKSVLIITLLVVVALVASGCEDAGQDLGCENFNILPPQETPGETVEEGAPPVTTTIKADDKAILLVQEHLLNLAASYQAKLYLADFYAACDDWTAELELFKDGTAVWYVTVKMTNVEMWEEKPQWQEACWQVFQDGEVMPSNRSQANALRIEADLQELSLQPES